MQPEEATEPPSGVAADGHANGIVERQGSFTAIPVHSGEELLGGTSAPEADGVPDDEQEAAAVKKVAEIMQMLADMNAKVFFEKPLTTSDASGSGRVVIPKAIAEQYFPKLDAQVGVTVEAVDTTGHKYHFRFRFWINNQSRMYLLEGAGQCHERYGLKSGDIMIFAQKPSGALVVAGRPSTQADQGRKLGVKRSGPGSISLPSSSRSKEQKKHRQDNKRRKSSHGSSIHYLPGPPDLLPPSDGIFRALPGGGPPNMPCGVASSGNGRWAACVLVAGEVYQAFFDSKEDALEAFNAAGELLDVPIPRTANPF